MSMQKSEVFNVDVKILEDLADVNLQSFYDTDPEYTSFEESLIMNLVLRDYTMLESRKEVFSDGSMLGEYSFFKQTRDNKISVDVNVKAAVHNSSSSSIEIVLDDKPCKSYHSATFKITNKLSQLDSQVEDSQK